MNIITIASSKGGVSKSLLSVCFYLYLKKQGKNTFLLDTDSQKSSIRFLQKLDKNDEYVDYCNNEKDFINYSKQLEEAGIEYLIVDTSPTITPFNTFVIEHSSKLVLCCKPALFDIESILDKLEVIKTSSTKHNACLLFTQVANNAMKTIKNLKELRQDLTSEGLITVLNNHLSHSTAYLNALNEIDNIFLNKKYSKQQTELERIFEEILKG